MAPFTNNLQTLHLQQQSKGIQVTLKRNNKTKNTQSGKKNSVIFLQKTCAYTLPSSCHLSTLLELHQRPHIKYHVAGQNKKIKNIGLSINICICLVCLHWNSRKWGKIGKVIGWNTLKDFIYSVTRLWKHECNMPTTQSEDTWSPMAAWIKLSRTS